MRLFKKSITGQSVLESVTHQSGEERFPQPALMAESLVSVGKGKHPGACQQRASNVNCMFFSFNTCRIIGNCLQQDHRGC